MVDNSYWLFSFSQPIFSLIQAIIYPFGFLAVSNIIGYTF